VESGNIPSIIFWGPPGVGKTTLAGIIASELKRPFYSLSAINSGVKEVRDVIEQARANKFFNSPPPILFIDEIHRFSKSQQDSLLGAVEKGVVTLIGATTENPSFEVIPALLSRCQVYILQHLDKEVLISLIDTALKEDEYLKKLPILIEEYDAILQFSGGDARKLLNIIELVANFQRGETVLKVNNEMVVELLQQNIALYDKNGEQHYDIISAFIKSMRGSDPNAAVYWLARMLEGGEDILFIARRMIILAAEDIGMANPNALLLANTCFQTCHQVGMPEARIILSQTAVYLATSAKSNSAYMAIEKAIELVRKTGNLPVPLPLRNAPTQLMKNINYGKGYQYAHDHPGNFVELEFLPDEISGTTLYQPANNPAEATVLQRLIFFWKKKYGY
jgi:putative ATPase